MRIAFRKVYSGPKEIHCELDVDSSYIDEHEKAFLSGNIERVSPKLVKFQGKLYAKLELICVKSGEPFYKVIEQDLTLYFSDGIWNIQSQTLAIESLDVIEFFDGFIDFDFVLKSEIESIRLDYNVKE
ncbi:hypothetical protein CQA66_01525 [Helicobacter aurati]|uniref:DUF177 domain-containing protein n=1 Tax=Helicobacter aurati TaxID=137778 RepID=A0A3D8J796_9HELI|nr:hypothetical protein [Helicobacter aurati]RDU73373.1 hypothetical protein CQA66_01525 [Helicobacter aurati]